MGSKSDWSIMIHCSNTLKEFDVKKLIAIDRDPLSKIFAAEIKKKYSESINEALYTAMKMDKSVICYGLGVDDPKRVFDTTKKLKEMFGSKRVFDVPASENALTGIGIGLYFVIYKIYRKYIP